MERKQFLAIEVTDKGHEIAESTYLYDPNKKQLETRLTYIDEGEKYSKQGFSTQFMDRALKSFPETRTLSANLIYENEIVFRKARKEGLSLSESFKQTPFYKTAKKFGFEEIDFAASNESSPLRLILRRSVE